MTMVKSTMAIFSLRPGLLDFGGSSLRRAAFVFVLKLKVHNDLVPNHNSLFNTSDSYLKSVRP